MNRHDAIQLVCFDVGGVLLRICRSWTEGCAAAGIDVRHDETQFQALRPKWARLVEEHQTGRLDLPEYARAVSALVDGMYSAAEVEAVHNAWVIDEFPRVADVIAELNDASIQTAALSNTNHAHWHDITRFPSIARLDALYASHELGLHKPDEAIYRAVEQKTGIAGNHILFFDDLPDNITAARNIGWRGTLIDPHDCTATQIRAALQQHGLLSAATR